MSSRYSRIFSVFCATILGLTLANVYVAPVKAQSSQASSSNSTLEEITVTGSRIRRKDYTANSPITTVNQALFQDTGTIGVSTVLNQLPQFVPAVTQFTTTDVQNSVTDTVGASTVSLRGLGPNRNLVLIDGRRGTPVNGALITDTNSIPSAAIQRVEIISGGASAVYGADAVGGVVNFILKDDFNGVQVDTRYGITQDGDNPELTLSGLFGASTSDGRGNVMLGIETSHRDAVRANNRSWYVSQLNNPKVNGTEFWFGNTFVSAAPGTGLPSRAAVDSIFPALPAGSIPTYSEFFINKTPDGSGTVFTGAGSFLGGTGAAGAYKYDGPRTLPNYPGITYRKNAPDGRITQNVMNSWLSIPLDRYSAFAKAKYKFTDSITGFIQASFSKNHNKTNLGYAGAALNANAVEIPYGTGIYGPSVVSLGADGLPNTGDAGEDMTTKAAYLAGGLYKLNCPATGGCTNSQAFPLPPEMQALMNSRLNPNGDVRINRLLDFVGSRRSESRTTTYQLVAGIKGTLPNDWYYNAYVSHGETSTYVTYGGMVARERYRAIVGSPNFGVGFQRQGNALGAGFAGGLATCTTGLPIVRDFKPSADCLKAIAANLQNGTQLSQYVAEADLGGDAWQLPAGTMQFSVGGTWRKDSYAYNTDDYTTNESFTENTLGLFPTSNTYGQFNVLEAYGELLVPVLKDLPLVKKFGLELGARYSDYSTIGGVTTYKVLGDWSVTDWARLRGGYNKATRAPNLAELYQARTQIFSLAPNYGDQCSENPTDVGPYSANPAANVNGASGAAATKALCQLIMGPTGAAAYYSVAPSAQPSGNSSSGLPDTIGNPNVQSEKAQTWTIGLTLKSPWDHPLLRTLKGSVDYYTIEITNMIAVESRDAVYAACFNPAINTTMSPTAPGCLAMTRDPVSGNAATVDETYTNEGHARFNGIDLQADWSADISDLGLHMIPGTLGVSIRANINMQSVTQAAPNQQEIDWAGTRGCALQMQCQQYDYRIFTTFSYMYGPWTGQLRWQHYPSIKAAQYASNTSTTFIGVPESYDMIDLSANYTYGEHITVRAGIDNLFDTLPPLGGGNPAAQPYPTQNTYQYGATYDPLGRRFYVGLTLKY